MQISGIQHRHLVSWERGFPEWFKVRVPDLSALRIAIDSFASLRTVYFRHGNGWSQEIIPAELFRLSSLPPTLKSEDRIPGVWLQNEGYQRSLLWVHHSLMDVECYLAVKACLTEMARPRTAVADVVDILGVQNSTRGVASTRHWMEFHSTQRGCLRDDKEVGGKEVITTETFRTNPEFVGGLVRLAGRSGISPATALLALVSSNTHRLANIEDATIQIVFSNGHLRRGRTSGACFAEEVYVPSHYASDFDDYANAVHRSAMQAYQHGVYNWRELQHLPNANGHTFYRDIGFNLIGADRLREGSMTRDSPRAILQTSQTEMVTVRFRKTWLVNVRATVDDRGMEITVRTRLPKVSPTSVVGSVVAQLL